MRRFPLTAALVALACVACSKEAAKPPAAPVEAATTAPVVEPHSPSPERVVRVVPARERRIHALINTAISRDVTGATEEDAAMWQATRAACKTQACVDRAYAAQETELRIWEGS